MTQNDTDIAADQIFVARAAALRSKGVAAFLFLNWGLMGWFTIRAPSATFAAFTFLLGLIALAAGMSQFRSSRRAGEIPLIRWTDEIFAFRTYTRTSWVEIPWSRMVRASPGSDAKPAKGHPRTGNQGAKDRVEMTIDRSRIRFLGWPSSAHDEERREELPPRHILGLDIITPADRARLLAELDRHLGVQTLD